jgi:glycosyltransferase involved in cell wall biosynthesis
MQVIDLLQWGGAQKMQVFLAEQLNAHNVELTVASLNASADSPVPEFLRQHGARVVIFPFPKFLSIRSFWGLFNFVRREKFDLIHAHLTYANIFGTLIGRMTGTPVIASLRTAGYDPRYHRPLRQFIETVVVKYGAQRIMANGQVVAELGSKRFAPRRIDVIPNAIALPEPLPIEERTALRTKLTGDATRPIVISVGRLDLPKGFPDLLEAFDVVRKTHPRAALLLAGDGPLREQLDRQVGELGLEGHVFLLGQRDDVGTLLEASDLYVTSSHWEGLPVSVLEAMAAGLPVIATTVGELPYLVVRQAGSLVPPRQPERLAAEINNLLLNPERMESMGTAGREHIRKNFSPEVWVRQLLTLYAGVCPPARALLD